MNSPLDSSADASRDVSGHDTIDLAPTRDGDSLIATFVMFVARLARCTTFDIDLTETRTTPRSATLQVRLDPSATVAAMHDEVDLALAQARAELSATRTSHALPVGVALVNRLNDPLPTSRMLTLVLTEGGAARWHYDKSAFSRSHIESLVDRFTTLLEIRAGAKWSRASVPGATLGVTPTPVSRSEEVQSV